MQFVQVSDTDEVRILKLSRDKANAINLQMVEELIESVQYAGSVNDVRAVVLGSATSGFFSAGFDVGEVFSYNVAEMRHFFGRFVDLYENVLRFPKPVIGALSGHVFAGGAFLALAFDVRVMAEGKWGFALNEINLGVILPPGVRRMLINAVGAHEATRMILSGDSVGPRRALEIGLVDEVVHEQDVLPTAIARAHKLAEKPAGVYSFSKNALQHDLGYAENSSDRGWMDGFLAQWFSPECTERRLALAASLGRSPLKDAPV